MLADPRYAGRIYGAPAGRRPPCHAAVMLALAACLIGSTVTAQTTFVATIDGLQNVPPNPVPGTGTATLVLNDAQTELAFDIEFTGLVGEETVAHIHNGSPRENGPAVFLLPYGSPKTGVWEIPPDMVTELFASRIYINIHSDIYITGEIRGNVMIALPVKPSSWGAIKALFGASR